MAHKCATQQKLNGYSAAGNKNNSGEKEPAKNKKG
jgi:hypothetical protein